MTPLDVISLADAKNFLKVDFDDDDALIESLISAAITLVEQKTQYRLYQRNEVLNSDGTYPLPIFLYPLTTVSVTNLDNAPIAYATVKRDPVRALVSFSSYEFRGYADNIIYYGASSLPLYKIICNVGYTDILLIPAALISAAKTLLTYMYENRDMATTDMPSNVSLELQPFVRAPLF